MSHVYYNYASVIVTIRTCAFSCSINEIKIQKLLIWQWQINIYTHGGNTYNSLVERRHSFDRRALIQMLLISFILRHASMCNYVNS